MGIGICVYCRETKENCKGGPFADLSRHDFMEADGPKPLPSSLGPNLEGMAVGELGLKEYGIEGCATIYATDLLPEIQKALLESGKWEKLKEWLGEQDKPMRGELDYHSGSVVLRKMLELEKP